MKKAARLEGGTKAIRPAGGERGMVATAQIKPVARSVASGKTGHPSHLILPKALYRTDLGAAYAGDALGILQALPDRSINVVVTSPPYALHFKKEYGNVDKQSYVQW